MFHYVANLNYQHEKEKLMNYYTIMYYCYNSRKKVQIYDDAFRQFGIISSVLRLELVCNPSPRSLTEHMLKWTEIGFSGYATPKISQLKPIRA